MFRKMLEKTIKAVHIKTRQEKCVINLSNLKSL